MEPRCIAWNGEVAGDADREHEAALSSLLESASMRCIVTMALLRFALSYFIPAGQVAPTHLAVAE